MDKEGLDGPAREEVPTVKQIEKLKELLTNAKYIVAFTGAGVSTAANIPDFRGDNGIYAKGILSLQEHVLDFIRPTYTHLALRKLVEEGIVKFIVTSNHDNLHFKSGISADKIAELFGNAYIEKCLKCSKIYRRSVVTPNINRKCEQEDCKGRLVKTGVRFGQETPSEPLHIGQTQAKKM